MHGAGTRGTKQREHAERKAQREAAAGAAATYGLPIDVDPGEALVNEVKRTYGHVVYLLAKVQEQTPDALVWGQVDETHKGATEFPGVDSTYAAKPNAWLDLYRQERDHLRRVCTDALKAGVEERRVRMAEQQGELIVQAIRGVLADLGVADHPDAPAAVRRHLTAIEA